MRKNSDKTENKENARKLSAGFSLLDEKDHEHIFDVLQALLFTKLKMAFNYK